MIESMTHYPHRRFNLLTREWVLVSPHRLQRPWQGKSETIADNQRPSYDPKCYLCPGNKRAGSQNNPEYTGTFVFTNDFSALLPDSPPASINVDGLLIAESERGICRVVCFSPDHHLTLAEMTTETIERVIETWADECVQLADDPSIRYIQVFENKGALMGCSNPHPHGQIWATQSVPVEVMKEDQAQRDYFREKGSSLLGDYAKLEDQKKERTVYQNDHWMVFVPWWAKWPYETLLLPKRHVASLPELSQQERVALADALSILTIRYDNLFQTTFPYTMGFHQAPSGAGSWSHWHLHAHFYPPLLRSATVQKFMVGFEMLAMAQRDITPETAAEQLRALPDIHFRKNTP